MSRERVRGIIAIVIAVSLCGVLVIVVVARIKGVPLSERGQTAVITLVAALIAALGAYLTTNRK